MTYGLLGQPPELLAPFCVTFSSCSATVHTQVSQECNLKCVISMFSKLSVLLLCKCVHAPMMPAADVIKRLDRSMLSICVTSAFLSQFCLDVWHQFLNSVMSPLTYFGLQFVANILMGGGQVWTASLKKTLFGCMFVSPAWGTGDLQLFCPFCVLHAEISADSLSLFMTWWAVDGKSWWSSSSWYCPLLPVNPQPGALRTALLA